MSVASPAAQAGSRVAFTVSAGGKPIDSSWQVVSIDTWSMVNRVPRAQVVLYDGNPAKSTFAISSAEAFLPGSKVKIEAGYGQGARSVVFSGEVMRQAIEIGETGASRLVVEVTDPSLRMTLARRSAVFTKLKDSALMETLIRASGLTARVTGTSPELPEIVQYYASDWDLMVTRAELNGMVVMADAGTVTVAPPNTSTPAVLALKYGESVLDLRAELDAPSQLASSAIRSLSWDPAAQKVVEAGPAGVSVKEPGNVSSEELARVFGVKRFDQQTGGPLEQASLQGWSSAELLKSRLAKIRGWVRFQGSATVKPGVTLELQGLGTRFNGTAWVSGVHHNFSNGQWITTADFGLSPAWFAAEAPAIEAPQASGQLPGIQGLQTGIVKKVGADPGGEFRVQVNLPLVGDATAALVWARLATFYAGNKMGTFFYPEPGDEVVVGFMNDDPRFPVVLGSVYSKKLAPPLVPDDKNDKKAIVTRGKLEIGFDDKDGVLEIRTPRHSIRLDDKTGEVTVKDGSQNTVVLSKSGIAVESAKEVTITGGTDVTIEARANLTLKAGGTASLEGAVVNAKATGKLSAQGALAELKASGVTQVQGALVKIN